MNIIMMACSICTTLQACGRPVHGSPARDHSFIKASLFSYTPMKAAIVPPLRSGGCHGEAASAGPDAIRGIWHTMHSILIMMHGDCWFSRSISPFDRVLCMAEELKGR